MIAVPGACFCTRSTNVSAAALALAMCTFGSTGAGAGGAGGSRMAWLAAFMPTQQCSPALLPTRQMLVAAARDGWSSTQTSLTCSKQSRNGFTAATFI